MLIYWFWFIFKIKLPSNSCCANDFLWKCLFFAWWFFSPILLFQLLYVLCSRLMMQVYYFHLLIVMIHYNLFTCSSTRFFAWTCYIIVHCIRYECWFVVFCNLGEYNVTMCENIQLHLPKYVLFWKTFLYLTLFLLRGVKKYLLSFNLKLFH